MIINFIARQSLIPGVLVGDNYQIEVGTTKFTASEVEDVRQSISKGGVITTSEIYNIRQYSIETMPIRTTLGHDEFKMFFDSVRAGQSFTIIDPYGNPIVCTRYGGFAYPQTHTIPKIVRQYSFSVLELQ